MVLSECDFSLVFHKMPLCLYETLVTHTNMTKRAFTLPLFHSFEASTHCIIISDFNITQEYLIL